MAGFGWPSMAGFEVATEVHVSGLLEHEQQ
jgi:hypothetical protein